jgi:hypothetical protein
VTLSGFAEALREDKGTRNKDKGDPIKKDFGASAFILEPLTFSLCCHPTSPTSRSWKTEFTRESGNSTDLRISTPERLDKRGEAH